MSSQVCGGCMTRWPSKWCLPTWCNFHPMRSFSKVVGLETGRYFQRTVDANITTCLCIQNMLNQRSLTKWNRNSQHLFIVSCLCALLPLKTWLHTEGTVAHLTIWSLYLTIMTITVIFLGVEGGRGFEIYSVQQTCTKSYTCLTRVVYLQAAKYECVSSDVMLCVFCPSHFRAFNWPKALDLETTLCSPHRLTGAASNLMLLEPCPGETMRKYIAIGYMGYTYNRQSKPGRKTCFITA